METDFDLGAEKTPLVYFLLLGTKLQAGDTIIHIFLLISEGKYDHQISLSGYM